MQQNDNNLRGELKLRWKTRETTDSDEGDTLFSRRITFSRAGSTEELDFRRRICEQELHIQPEAESQILPERQTGEPAQLTFRWYNRSRLGGLSR